MSLWSYEGPHCNIHPKHRFVRVFTNFLAKKNKDPQGLINIPLKDLGEWMAAIASTLPPPPQPPQQQQMVGEK